MGTGVDAADLEPITRPIHVDAFGNLLRHPPGEFYRSSADHEPPELEVSFRYEGCEVTVTPSEIRVGDP